MSLQASTHQVIIFLTTVEALPSLLPVHSPGSVPISLFGCECHLASLPTWFPRPGRDMPWCRKMQSLLPPWKGKPILGMGHVLFFPFVSFLFFFFMSEAVLRHPFWWGISLSLTNAHLPLILQGYNFPAKWDFCLCLGFQTSWTSLNPTSLPPGNAFFPENQRNSVHS